ncbi:hypothetical protein GCM10009039_32000 [Halocalculus aciditolerans]|uniref:Uncharacterized protein n=1 Tax=Halocalculus aciditolerans TaxID=1383812 RepID=A0A830FFW6_9EURY|nr:hypothetical protein GCM10009039_32000 [Halocalculus aciditolerans]
MKQDHREDDCPEYKQPVRETGSVSESEHDEGDAERPIETEE